MLAQIRFGILLLHIETGRFRELCLRKELTKSVTQSIEDEFHFILIWNEYNELRMNLFNSIKHKVETLQYLHNRENKFQTMGYEWKL